MKKSAFIILACFASLICYSQENKLIFASELDFMNSLYAEDAILKFRATISSGLVTDCAECSKLKAVGEFKNPQQALYKKYESLLPLFGKSYCIVPKYFLKHKDGTYTLMINFIDLGVVAPENSSPVDVLHAFYNKIETLVDGVCFISKSIKNNQISRIQMSFCYRESSRFYDKPHILAFSTSIINIENFHNGKITEKQFFSKVRAYHTGTSNFIRIL